MPNAQQNPRTDRRGQFELNLENPARAPAFTAATAAAGDWTRGAAACQPPDREAHQRRHAGAQARRRRAGALRKQFQGDPQGLFNHVKALYNAEHGSDNGS